MRFLYVAVSLLVTFHASTAAEYFGKYLGPLKGNNHGVSGDVYAVDARTFYIKDFSYDGEGPAAYFYVGSTKTVNGNGHRLTDEKGSANALPAYRKKSITLSFPEGKTLNNIKWFSVWCDEAAVSFADIKIPKNLDFPKPQKISPLAGIHAVSSEPIVVVDAQTLLIPSFSYDGEAPDAKFWAGRGDKPSPQGVRIPDENGKEIPLRKYDRKTIVLTLPGDLTIFDIGHFGVWCEAFTVDFGHIRVPRGLNVPPSLKMLGVSPQKKSRSLHLSALQQSVQDSETYSDPDELQQSSDKNNFNYKNVLPLFNVQQIVRPTTYKPQFLQQPTFIHSQKQPPPSSHRFNQKQKNGYLPLNNNPRERIPEDNVQIIPSIALVPEASSDSFTQTQFGLFPPPEQQFVPEQNNQEQQQVVTINKKEGGHIIQRHFPVEQSHDFSNHRQQRERFNNNNNQQESPFPLPPNGFTISHSLVVADQSQIDEQSAQVPPQPFQQEPNGELIVPQFINNGFYSTDFPGSDIQKIQQQQQPLPQPKPKLLPQPQRQLQPRLQIDRIRTDGSNKSFSRILLNSATGTHDSFVQYK